MLVRFFFCIFFDFLESFFEEGKEKNFFVFSAFFEERIEKIIIIFLVRSGKKEKWISQE